MIFRHAPLLPHCPAWIVIISLKIGSVGTLRSIDQYAHLGIFGAKAFTRVDASQSFGSLSSKLVSRESNLV